MTVLLNVVLPVFLVAGVTALAHDRLRFDVQTLSRAVFYLFAPALVFDAMTNSDVSGAELGQIAAVVVLSTAVLWLLAVLAARWLRLEGPTQAAFLNAILLMNAGNFGLSVNLFAFGQPGLARASLYFTVSAVLSASLGVYISASGRASARAALNQVVTVPMVYAAAVGLVLNLTGWQVPGPLARAIELLGQASVPVMLAVLGAKLAVTVRSGVRALRLPALAVVTVTRLAIAPALAWGLAWLVGLDGLARDVTIVESAMPTAVVTTILATEFEADSAFAALCVFVTTLASLGSLTLLLNLLT
jgi:malate permease and related proteins